YASEALDKMLRDILGYKSLEKRCRIFGGMTILLGGEFRQILLVILKAKRSEVVQACINRSELGKYCKISTLTRSMRVNEYSPKKERGDEATWIEIPEEFLIKSWDSPIEQIVSDTYPNFTTRKTDDEYIKEREILTPRNEDADAINEYMFKKLGGAPDEICKATTNSLDQHYLYPVEFLNSLNFLGMPPMPST
ncbi:ATP-dependent DNA helicase PIF1-like protein, partial [Tanacetum coccineum]